MFQGGKVARLWLILSLFLATFAGCSSRHPAKENAPTNVVGFQLPTHWARDVRRGQHYDLDRASIESRLQKMLKIKLAVSADQDGVISQYESRLGKFHLKLTGTRTGVERATIRLHRVETLNAKQKEARESELTLIAQILLLGEEGTKWVCEAACGSVTTAIRQATEVHEFGKATYALKAFEHADAEIDNEPSNPRLWICIGPHIEFEKPETK